MCKSDQPGDGGFSKGRRGSAANLPDPDSDDTRFTSLRGTIDSLRTTLQAFLQARRSLREI